ncbi:hypothetical protein [Kurthia senegalensis]|uniref:lmo0954 family membrane protein n=1 Tax=Kurthia senegalensis TaxID=1033740 RepID=UPI000289D1E9|nr:hypothetical protein [Kurthia senegalensis]
MKKFMLACIGIIAAIIILATLGPLGGLLFSGAIAYAGIHFYIKANSTFAKIVWGLVIVAAGLSVIANFPGLLAAAALVGLYYLYKKGSFGKKMTRTKSTKNDPFQNFEKEWSNLTK